VGLYEGDFSVPEVEFGNRPAANEARDQWADHLCSQDDRRLKTVTFAPDTSDEVLVEARQQAADSRAEGEGTAGQVPLTDHEKGEIDFSKGRANVMHARSIKGIAMSEGVDDWLAYYDPEATVDEHREIMAEAATEGGGKRREDTETATEKAGRAARTAQGEQCDHARDHCEHGDPEACEFLAETCDYSEQEIDQILGGPDTRHEQQETTTQRDLVTVGGDRYPEMEVTPQEAGALTRSWQGYKSAVARLGRLLDEVRDATTNARQAWAVVNAIRDDHGQEELHPDDLHELLDSLAGMPGSIPETRTLDHFVGAGDQQNQQRNQQPDQQRSAVIETDDQQTLGGDRANDQARLAGGEQGEQGQGEAVEAVDENPGGIMADERTETSSDGSTEQQVPDEFQVAEGGQETL